MEDKNYLIAQIRKCKRKMNLAKLIDCGILYTAAGGVLGVLCEAISLFRQFYYADLAALLCFGIGLFVGICRAVAGRADMKRAAGKLDSFGLKERMLTAYERIDAEDEFARLLRRDAASHYSRVQGQIRISLFPAWRHILALFLSILAVVGLRLFPSPVRDQAKLRHQVQEQAEEEREMLEEFTDALEGVDMESLTEEQRAKLQELLKAMELSQEDLATAASFESLSAAAQRLDYKYRQAAQELERLAGQMEHPEAAGIASAEALAKAAANQTGHQTASAGVATGASGQENGQGAEGGQDGTGSGTENGQNGTGSEAGSGQGGEGSGAGNGQAGTGQGAGNGQDGNGSGAGSGQGGTGQGTGSGSGTGGGRGTGSSNAAHDYVSIPNELAEDDSLTGNKTGDQNSDYFREQNGLAWEGDHVDYSAVIGEYTDSAYEGLANGQYPSGMEPVIRDYFEQLNK